MSDILWSGAELEAVMAGQVPMLLSMPPGDATSVSIDTRSLEPGALFFALRGDAQGGKTNDGHAYVRQAFDNGAVGAVVERSRTDEFSGMPVVLVDDTLHAMEALGRAGRARFAGKVIAVTGSVGKTSTKEMLKTALSVQGKTHVSFASYNNHWGVPLTLARTPADAAYAVYEIGMNNPFEILPLSAMVRPHIAIVTTVEPVHLAQFNSVAAIADAKGEIFSGLEPGGVALINVDNSYAARLKAHASASSAGRIVTFGTSEGADIRLCNITLAPDFSFVEAYVFGRPITYRIGVAGRHFALNSLAVVGAATLAGADLSLCAQALAQFGYIEGRGQRIKLAIGEGFFTLIDESYNANPASMRAALAVTGAIPPGPGGRRIAVLGDMLELGEQGPRLHAELGEVLVAQSIDLVFCAGNLMENLFLALPMTRRGAYAENAEDLASLVLEVIAPGDVIVIKGSNGVRMSRVVSALKARYTTATEQAAG